MLVKNVGTFSVLAIFHCRVKGATFILQSHAVDWQVQFGGEVRFLLSNKQSENCHIRLSPTDDIMLLRNILVEAVNNTDHSSFLLMTDSMWMTRRSLRNLTGIT